MSLGQSSTKPRVAEGTGHLVLGIQESAVFQGHVFLKGCMFWRLGGRGLGRSLRARVHRPDQKHVLKREPPTPSPTKPNPFLAASVAVLQEGLKYSDLQRREVRLQVLGPSQLSPASLPSPHPTAVIPGKCSPAYPGLDPPETHCRPQSGAPSHLL